MSLLRSRAAWRRGRHRGREWPHPLGGPVNYRRDQWEHARRHSEFDQWWSAYETALSRGMSRDAAYTEANRVHFAAAHRR